MNPRSFSTYLICVCLSIGCAKNAHVNVPIESTTQLYPFEPIPIPAYEGVGMATHRDLHIAQEMARSQAMADLASNIFETVSSRVTEVVSSTGQQASLLNVARNLSTTVPLVGKKFIEYRVGDKTGRVYARVYMAKSEIDEYLMKKLVGLSQDLIDKPIRERLTREIISAGAVNADVQALTLFYQQQLTKRGNQREQ